MKLSGRYVAALIGTVLIVLIIIAERSFNHEDPFEPAAGRCAPFDRNRVNGLLRNATATPLNKLILLSPQPPSVSSPPQLIVLIPTVASEVQQRQTIRDTWANPNESTGIQSGNARLMFVIGSNPQSPNDTGLAGEVSSHGDILLISVEETYTNLIFKELVAFRWTTIHFSNAHILKTDVDVVVHVDRLLQQLGQLQLDDNTILCNHYTHNDVERDECHRWYVPHSAYPHSHFPQYCAGAGYLMTGHAIGRLVNAAAEIEAFTVEDAFLTGVAASKAALSHRCATSFMSHIYSTSSCCSSSSPSLSVVCLHGQKPSKDMKIGWNMLKNISCDGNCMFERVKSMVKCI